MEVLKPKIGQRYRHNSRGYELQIIDSFYGSTYYEALADEVVPTLLSKWDLANYYILIPTNTTKDKLKELEWKFWSLK